MEGNMSQPMTPDQVRTAWIMLGLVIGICIVDAWLIRFLGHESSFSMTLRAIGERWGAFPFIVSFACGALVAHCFW